MGRKRRHSRMWINGREYAAHPPEEHKDYRDVYVAAEPKEADYAEFRFQSKWEYRYPAVGSLSTVEVEKLLTEQVLSNPFTQFGDDFSAPRPWVHNFPGPPADPRPALRARYTLEPSLPPEPEMNSVSPANLNILGIKLEPINSTITKGRERIELERYEALHRNWRAECRKILAEHKRASDKFEIELQTYPEVQKYFDALSLYESELDKQKEFLAQAEKQWNLERLLFLEASEAEKGELELLHARAASGDGDAIEGSAVLCIRSSIFQSESQIAKYDPETKTLFLEIDLPNFDDIEVHEIVKTTTTQKQKTLSQKRLSDCVQYATHSFFLRAAYDLAEFFGDTSVQAIALNGRITHIDRATGNLRTDTIMSLFCELKELRKLNIANVDPKQAFRALKGVSSPSIFDRTPVAPIYTFNADDGRIVEGREVFSRTSEGENLGAMHWEDFEHLIRELFEMEFSAHGAQVKVTRASRDSGVDALVFNPDPIKGGTIVIQAKRYVNTVDASAVRDLYGTVQSEGANKGILITTSSFGPESYAFAKGKPLTLLNGDNLIWLLQKHGKNFTINLQEARVVLKERGWL